MPCGESLRVQAYFDGELDALNAAEVERHAEACPECRALLEDLQQLRTALQTGVGPAGAPPALRARILRTLDSEVPAAGPDRNAERLRDWRSRPFWKGALSGIAGTAIAAGIAFLVLGPPLADPLVEDLVNAQVRSLMPNHLIEVVSTDKHTVKPWFAGRTDVSPVVADFAQQGYRLVGGRADYLEHQRAAVVVYEHGPHVINVFSWAATRGGLPKNTTRNGYHLAFWRTGNLVYCAVSDTGLDELKGLVRLLQDLGVGDGRPAME